MLWAVPDYELIEADGREVRISSGDRVVFPEAGVTKRALIEYHLALVRAAACAACAIARPT